LSAAVEALVSMHDALTPSPSSVIPPAAERFAPLFGCWRLLAEASVPPEGLDAWSTRHLDQLSELESGWTAASVGTTLLHGDLRSDNMLVTGDGRIVVIDWPHAAVGAPILDVVCWAPSVVLEGGPLPEELLASHQNWRQVDQDAVAVLVAAVAGFFIEHSLRPAPPGLPTLRAFQAAQGEVARAWLERITAW
jgi:aminoglycoside phosphotransferase (APT) family kinase protein